MVFLNALFKYLFSMATKTSDNPDDNTDGKAYWAENTLAALFDTERKYQIHDALDSMAYSDPFLAPEAVITDEALIAGTVAPSLLKTEFNTAFFWSGRTEGFGGAERALEIAKQQGGTTLEGMIESKGIKMPEWDINNPDSIKEWEDVSKAYAKQVSGEVRAVVGSTLREGNIWENVELPRLLENSNVSTITIIDPKTLVEKVIMRR